MHDDDDLDDIDKEAVEYVVNAMRRRSDPIFKRKTRKEPVSNDLDAITLVQLDGGISMYAVRIGASGAAYHFKSEYNALLPGTPVVVHLAGRSDTDRYLHSWAVGVVDDIKPDYEVQPGVTYSWIVAVLDTEELDKRPATDRHARRQIAKGSALQAARAMMHGLGVNVLSFLPTSGDVVEPPSNSNE